MMLAVSNFLEKEDLDTFVNFAYEFDKINTVPCLKSHWVLNSAGSTHNVTRISPLKNHTVQAPYHSGISESLQNSLYDNLKNFWEKYSSALEQHGKAIIDKSFSYSRFYLFFQYTDIEESYVFHSHPNESLVGVLYLYPEKSTGTIFKDTSMPWEVNKMVLFTGDVEHNFENVNDRHKRFTLNFFMR